MIWGNISDCGMRYHVLKLIDSCGIYFHSKNETPSEMDPPPPPGKNNNQETPQNVNKLQPKC